MGLDTAPQHYQTAVTEVSWPKCWRCTARMRDGLSVAQESDFSTVKMAGLYPVEKYGIVGREDSKIAGGRYRLIVEAGCHGQEMRFAVEIPRHWGQTSELVVLGAIDCFKPAGPGRVKAELNSSRLRGVMRDLRTEVH